MRLVIDSLIAVMLVAILGGVVWAHKTQERQDREYQRLHTALAKLHEQAVYHGALGDIELSRTGFPQQMAPAWFGEQLPINVLADSRRPWIDVAPPGDMADHPPDPILTHADQAGFWYNPNRGVFRARVPALETDQTTLDLYNQINHSAFTALPYHMDLARQPIVHHPLAVSTAQADTPVTVRPYPVPTTISDDDVLAEEGNIPATPSMHKRPTLRGPSE